MKKSLLVAFVFAMVMFGAKAEYLYWQVGNDTFGTGDSYYVGVYNESGGRVGDAYTGSLAMTGPMVADIGTSGSYYIEVWTYTETSTETGSTGTKGDSQGRSATFTYQELADMNAIATSREWSQSTLSTLGHSLAVWNATNVVPEPTSGLLTMIGLALLGLKRRRV